MYIPPSSLGDFHQIWSFDHFPMSLVASGWTGKLVVFFPVLKYYWMSSNDDGRIVNYMHSEFNGFVNHDMYFYLLSFYLRYLCFAFVVLFYFT